PGYLHSFPTRRSSDLMFPDLVEAVKRQVRAREIIFEGEALAFDEGTGELLPFQTTIQRKRKHGVEDNAKEFPLKLFAFDLLYVEDRKSTRLNSSHVAS